MSKKPELLIPAGNMSKFEMALAYGADAVYLGGTRFGLRVLAGNFDHDELKQAVVAAHSMSRHVYVTVNLFPRDDDFAGMAEYLVYLQYIGVDAVIAADPGVVVFIKKTVPDMEIHLSTQANTMNSWAANFWHDQGVSRIILARELSLSDIERIRKSTPNSLELEVFVHGSMCMAYSGRCAISSYLTGREANRGHCTQPCRWEYHLVEEKRPGEFFRVEEDQRGLFFFNSKDLNMMPHLKALRDAGIDALKVEGRMKSEHYVAAVTAAYRREIDRLHASPDSYAPLPESLAELNKVTYRPYGTGFFFGSPGGEGQNVEKARYMKEWDYVAKVIAETDDQHTAWFEEFNPFSKTEELEVLRPGGSFEPIHILEIAGEEGEPLDEVKQPRRRVLMRCDRPVSRLCILRRKND